MLSRHSYMNQLRMLEVTEDQSLHRRAGLGAFRSLVARHRASGRCLSFCRKKLENLSKGVYKESKDWSQNFQVAAACSQDSGAKLTCWQHPIQSLGLTLHEAELHLVQMVTCGVASWVCKTNWTLTSFHFQRWQKRASEWEKMCVPCGACAKAVPVTSCH